MAEGVIATSVASGPDGSTVRRLRRSVFAEVVVALLVLAVTALLVNAEPAKEAVAQPYSGSVSALGVQVNVILDPARAATDNEFEIYAVSYTHLVLTRSSSVRHRLAALAVGGVLAVIALVALAAPASAHAQLESTVPPEGSILAHSPEAVSYTHLDVYKRQYMMR